MDDPRMTGEESQMIVELYDSYMKTVLRNRSRTLQRRYYKRAGIESITAEPAEYLTKAAAEDGSSNKSVIEDHGFRCEVNDNRMFEALTALPVNLRLVIVMWYWYSKRTQEIAEHFGVSGRTILNWHNKALAILRDKLRKEGTDDAS